MNNAFWQGERVTLRAIEPSNWETFWLWDRDSEMQRMVDRLYPPRSQEAQKQWAMKMATQETEDDNYFFVIENLDGEIVGCINPNNCDSRNGTFRYGVAIRREHWRKGYASEAIVMLMRYFFRELRYQKATIPVYSFNDASIHLHEHLGFQLEGRLRRIIYTQGQFFDELFFGMTAEEFDQRHTG